MRYGDLFLNKKIIAATHARYGTQQKHTMTMFYNMNHEIKFVTKYTKFLIQCYVQALARHTSSLYLLLSFFKLNVFVLSTYCLLVIWVQKHKQRTEDRRFKPDKALGTADRVVFKFKWKQSTLSQTHACSQRKKSLLEYDVRNLW